MSFIRRVILTKNLKNGEDVKRKGILVMDEKNAFFSGRTTLETNIINDMNQTKGVHPYDNMLNSK